MAVRVGFAPYDTVIVYVPAVVFWSTVQVSGDAPLFVHVIDPAPGVGATVHVAAVVRSNVVPLEVPCATKGCVVLPFKAFTDQVLVQEVTGTVVPWHT